MSGEGRASFHRVRVFDLPRLDVERQFSGVRVVGEGWRASVVGATHRASDTRVALKLVHKASTRRRDFFRELHYNYYLSPHPNIVTSYDAAFDTPTAYVFAQELAPCGDLSGVVRRGGVGEVRAKRVVEQVAFALEFMHTKELVHRDVRLHNILLFDKDLRRVKLADFGATQRAGTLVKKVDVRVPWAPPEVCRAVYHEGYHVSTALDAWQLGVLLFVLLTGVFPWAAADITDAHYTAWVAYTKRKTNKVPRRFRAFTPRLLRLLRRLLQPKPEKRAGVREAYKYLSDTWLARGADRLEAALDDSSSEAPAGGTPRPLQDAAEKHRLAELLRARGVQTSVDRSEATRRVCEWLLASHAPAAGQRGM
ncbi:serine/threonine-protein kinase SBK1-like [Portunus trituberculatus]|uniref:Serine/threonine-protein kinase SBK1 n=1 Tax=Portunus trituberculatus TaxID=210409 RepID=A0A5B7IAI7_PORTR|nr:serine/threonine-protein kinase SBK1-like [Portunus trituberculatus]XP_045112895.1 serine/threonine-protein kinase SBK1-like [Portunus trituberculatus]XP_045112906.1 serine/threonine-protein kinase SBK1-like [Portunus trituberculatus]MPC82441.1 Serine/threonine-protein kinase SBK1 [Portunus trituberculatus]